MPSDSREPRRGRVRVSIAAKFFATLFVMVPLSLASGWAGLSGLADLHERTQSLFQRETANNRVTATLALDAELVGLHAQKLIVLDEPSGQQRLEDELTNVLIPRVTAGVGRVAGDASLRPDGGAAVVGQLAARWRQFLAFYETGQMQSAASGSAAESANRRVTDEVGTIFASIATLSARLVAVEATQAAAVSHEARSSYDSDRLSLLLIAAAVILGEVAAIGWLIAMTVPRIRRYSRFSSRVASGDAARELRVTGNDDLADLGDALNEMVCRQVARHSDDQSQSEFAQAMQITETESEAYELLKRHLQISIPGCATTTLARNNSADRLLATTPVPDDSPLLEPLAHAKPRSCLAVRFARTHETQPGRQSLLDCAVCGGSPGRTSCVPLLVGGAVIGSVLSEHEHELTDRDRWSINESVSQAAPVLGNLRNLAIAEQRAATDALTGLPNRRTVQDTVKLLAAQAGRNAAPLAALALDLDHFKNINDSYGHERGDDVLAAAATAFRACVRDSDFVGRSGGEEFVVLLPATDLDNARRVAEKIRDEVSRIQIPTVQQPITVSIGIALIPDHASSAEILLRHADRALYAAKNNGRNRVETFTSSPTDQSGATTPTPQPAYPEID